MDATHASAFAFGSPVAIWQKGGIYADIAGIETDNRQTGTKR